MYDRMIAEAVWDNDQAECGRYTLTRQGPDVQVWRWNDSNHPTLVADRVIH